MTIAFNVAPTLSGYTSLRTKQFEKQLLDRVSALPGVNGMAFAQMGLLEGNEWDSTVSVEGYQAQQGEQMNPYCNSISAGYFRMMGIPLLLGRALKQCVTLFPAGGAAPPGSGCPWRSPGSCG